MLELELLRALCLRHIICLPEGNKQRERHKLLISCSSILYAPVLKYEKEGLEQEGGCGLHTGVGGLAN